MKKRFALLFALVLMVGSFAACGSEKLTMKKLIEANQTDVLLESYDSIYIRNVMDGEMYAEYYLTDACSYEKRENWAMCVTDDTGYGYQDGVYARIVCLTRDGLVDYADYRAGKYADTVLSKKSLQEKIQSVAETEDQITVKSVMKEKSLEKIIGNESLRSLENTYVLDAKTYGVMTIDAIVTLDDGRAYDVLMEGSYNAQAPEEIEDLLAFENQTEDLRTVTMVFHAGTQKEKVEQVQAPKGLSIWMVLPDDSTEIFSIYADAACTEPYQSNGDYTSDVTVYIK